MLRCAGSDSAGDCRAAVLSALDQALADKANWTGEELPPPEACVASPCTVEEYDAVTHSNSHERQTPAPATAQTESAPSV